MLTILSGVNPFVFMVLFVAYVVVFVGLYLALSSLRDLIRRVDRREARRMEEVRTRLARENGYQAK